MSQFKSVLKELSEMSNQIATLVANESWDVLDEVLEMIQLFGERITSNGIRTQEDIIALREIKNKDRFLYANIVYDNLQLLITEYEQLAKWEKVDSLIFPFRFEDYQMALIKDGKSNHRFINETAEELESVLKQISNDTEAIILVGYGSGFLYSTLTKSYHTLVLDHYALPIEVQDKFVLSSFSENDKYLLNERLQSFIGLKTAVIAHPLYTQSHELIELLTLVRNLLEEVQIVLNTRMTYTEKWYKEIFMNSINISNQSHRVFNIDQLKNRYKTKKVLMIAGGPSLEDALPYLKNAQHAYYIIAIGQTVKVLLDHQIKPDYVISIDVSEANAYFFKDVELDIPLIYSLQVNHHIPKSSKGLLIPYADTLVTKDLLPYSNTTFSTFPTVALAAVAFANYLGFEEIGLIGQDLALREGEYYSASVKQSSSNDGLFHKKLYDIPLNNGQIGKTTPVLRNFLKGYSSLLKLYPELKTKLVNYAEQGALIEHVTCQPINTLQTAKITKEKLQIDEKCSSIHIPVGEVQEIFVGMINQLERLTKQLGRMIKQKAVTIDEFEKLLRSWDDMIIAPSFRTHIMPLQVVNILIIQNKIYLHNQHKTYSHIRLEILSFMHKTVETLIRQLKNIQGFTVEV
ncbi:MULTISPECIES: 6-hydroxymethylpterin diphosphokinase MptE-like protein [unclassified Exiguobacterium]|uniref:motility associated factor glycosyltransferase family protein n=1 Tax=unclassified Exiguobacterium TaxID=2644629 RepID=UPI001BE78C4B|nr:MULTISPECIES: 6-hydroxymethylpterin diphosphokinase MptE-like protein [unclassified Exiguobacterium]